MFRFRATLPLTFRSLEDTGAPAGPAAYPSTGRAVSPHTVP